MAHIIAGAVASSLVLLFTIFFVAWRRSRNRISKEEGDATDDDQPILCLTIVCSPEKFLSK